MHPVCIYRIFPNGNTDTAAGSTERDHKKILPVQIHFLQWHWWA